MDDPPLELLPDPSDPGLELLHTRDYAVKSYRRDDATIVIRGAVRDTKPAGVYVPEDPDPLVVHHMLVELTVELPSLLITSAEVIFERHPTPGCPSIVPHYGNLVGLSIARGFTHEVRRLFGGPRGCTHTTALLQAMGPVAMQSMWSMTVRSMWEQPARQSWRASPDTRETRIAQNLNTCHVWAEASDYVETIRAGAVSLPMTVLGRYGELGRSPDPWMQG
jgi:hypothetical protein